MTILALPALLLSGCGVESSTRGPEPRFGFSYQADSGEGYMNQTLIIENFGTRSYAPVLHLYAVDDRGSRLSGVTVTGIFGSDGGELVVPARGAVVDVMRFEGPDVERVTDVRAIVVAAPVVDFPAEAIEPQVTPLEAAGAAVTRNDVFVRVRISNEDDDPITVRLVYIVWDTPPEGRTQQAVQTEPIGDLVTVPANGETEVAVAPDDADVIREVSGVYPASIKAYFSV